jgi:hypothetical protein
MIIGGIMRNKDAQFRIVWENEPSPEAEERLLAAFEMIFKDISIDLPEDLPI